MTNECAINSLIKNLKSVREIDTKQISDTYHTFEELYHHRAILFSVICNQNQDIAWKSKKHHDGAMFENMFIVGIDTPEGQYTYHYNMEYWDLFDVTERKYAPVYDGHVPDDVTRLKSLSER